MIFCPACLLNNDLALVVESKCTKCNTKYKENSTLVSEDAVRCFIVSAKKEISEKLKIILEEFYEEN